jgi:hypothetical protein
MMLRTLLRKRAFVILCAFSLAVVLATAFWPTETYDIRRVQPQIRDLATPYASVRVNYHLDGGSLGVVIVDRGSRRLDFVLPVSIGNPKYQRLRIGTSDPSLPGLVEAELNEDTRRMLNATFDQYLTNVVNRDLALMALRGSVRGHVRGGAHVFVDACARVVGR